MSRTQPLPPRTSAWPSASLGRYLVAVMLLATVPVTALMSWHLFRSVVDEQARLREALRNAAGVMSRSVDREIDATADVLSAMAQQPSLRTGDLDAFGRALSGHLVLRPTWSGAFVVDRDGRVLLDSAGGAFVEGPGVFDAREFHALFDGAPLFVSDVTPQRSGGRHATAVAVPVAVEGSIRYALGAWVDSESWRRLLLDGGVPTGGYAGLADRRHRIVARTQAQERYVGTTLDAAAIARINAASAGADRGPRLEGDEAELVWQVVPRSGWRVVAGVPAAPADAAQRKAFLLALATAGVCALLGVTFALLVARRLTDPLRELATHGAQASSPPIVVREISMLRDALLAAKSQDEVARERLQRKADEFEALFTSSPIGLAFAQDAQCREVLYNPRLIELFGPPAHGEGGVRAWHDGAPLGADAWPLRRAARDGVAVADLELEVHVPGRPPRFVLASAVPLLDADGRTHGAIGAVVDITERKLAEARLLEADRRLRESQRLVDLAQEAGQVGFFHYGFRDDALAWTPGQAMLFGIESGPNETSLGEWVRRVDPSDRVPLSQSLRRLFTERRERGTLEFRVTLPDGGARWLSSRVLVTYGDDGEPQQMVGVTVDLTERQEVERQRGELMQREQAARIEAERSNRAKDEFLAMLGHELRNPLSAIASAVEVMERSGSDAQTASSARSIIARQTRHLTHMMGDLLDVARVMSGKVMLTRQRLELTALVERCIATQRLTGAVEQHQLDTKLEPVWVDADGTRIEQVVSNLLTNALKYTPEGGRIDVEVGPDGDCAKIVVRDTGMGIPPSLLPHVFDLFVQGERTLERRAGGLGIGLTLVRRLVELHDGRIVAESDGTGSTFTVRLPRVDMPVTALEPRRLPDSRRRRVLLVEDNADALEALSALLQIEGHAVSTASDGESGLAAVLAQRPDVAVVDIGLPKMDGFQVALKSRSGGYTGRMIALSGYGQEQDVHRAMRSGFDAHLVKPVDIEALGRLLYDD